MDLNPMAPPATYRRLSLTDLMLLVAVLALGMGSWSYKRHNMPAGSEVLPSGLADWIDLISTDVVALTWILAIRSSRLPRAERHEVGHLTCAGVVLGTLVQFVELATMIGFNPAVPFIANLLYPYSLSFSQPRIMVSVVGVAWWVSWRQGTWRRSSRANERLGRLIGGWFVIAFLLQCGLNLGAAFERAGSFRGLLFRSP